MKASMKNVTAVFLLCLWVSPVLANKDLARKSMCMGCHNVDRKVVGPAFKDVAKRYANQKDAVAQLAQRMRSGSQGRWGAVGMPAQESLTESDARALAQWIVEGAK